MISEDSILSLLKAQPGLKGLDVARRLNAEKSEANSILWKLKHRGVTKQDNAYRWYLVEKTAPRASTDNANTDFKSDTALVRLCRYYLECLSLEDQGGVSLFAQSKFAPDYLELPSIPGLGPDSLAGHEGLGQLLGRMRGNQDRRVPYVGYPVRVRWVRSAKGWEGFMLDPVFLFPLGEEVLRTGQIPSISDDAPVMNSQVIKRFSMGNESQIMGELARLAEELGLGEPDVPDIDEVVRRLVDIRKDWDWKEDINPEVLSSGNKLAQMTVEGIYNRCIVFSCERSPYTKGLEQELAKLQDIPAERLRGTALGMWIQGRATGGTPPAKPETLIEPLPLNTEQRQAIESALTRSLTIITGPPGTGKSQVVSSLLINAAKSGKRVLFASKNNKAVDVVEARVNNLGPRPVLLRLGRGEYQTKLTEYLTNLLAGKATSDDEFHYDEAYTAFMASNERIQRLQTAAEQTMALRNEVDALERKLEPLRLQIGEARFQNCRSTYLQEPREQLDLLRAAVSNATRQDQGWLVRCLWLLHRKERFQLLSNAANRARAQLGSIDLSLPNSPAADTDIFIWQSFLADALARIASIEDVGNYFLKLSRLSTSERIETIWQTIAAEREQLSKQSLNLWEYWLRLAPRRLSSDDRRLLGEFAAVMRLLVKSDQDDRFAGKHVYSQYFKMFPSMVSTLSCWAVTSLSLRGRVPLEPGFFDLVVIDEASQCDIASAIPLLYRAKAAVIIGDPKQLRHISSIQPRRDRELLERNGMADGFASWAYSENSVFDLACPLAAQEDIILLRDHHRSHSDIIEFSNQHFYEGQLRIATRHERLRNPSMTEPAIRWIAVEGYVTRPGSGALNEIEAQAVIREIERLGIEQDYKGSVGVVTPFRAQADRIRDLIQSHPKAELLLSRLDLLIDTVHKFQGDERDVMIFSPVVSQNMPEGGLSFLKRTGNLFNVAITRARAALIVVGDPVAAKVSGVSYLASFVEYVEGLRARRPTQIDLEELTGPAYPAVSNPHQVSDWERLFYCELWNAGIRPKPQYSEEKFILDFAVFSKGRKLDLEVDGERYHRDWNGELLRRDQLRNMRMMELGWDIMRFWVYQLRDDMPVCIRRVKDWVEQR